MITPKEYYRNYLADNTISTLNNLLCALISAEFPNHVLEFGSGTGKNLALIEKLSSDTEVKPCVCGLDISLVNFVNAYAKELPFLILGDETHLRHLSNFDIVFTCSALDHIQDVEGIIGEFKRIANRSIFLAETNDVIGEFYFPHDYESHGFQKLDYEWRSPLPEGDGALYNIWKWSK